MTSQGVDVSHYQGIIDWSRVDFGWIKSSEGLTGVDGRYDSQRGAAHVAGKPTGPYHFLRPGGDPAAQARHWRAAAGHLQAGDLRPAIDLEVEGFDAGWLRAFAEEAASQFGCPPILYTYKSHIDTHGWLAGFHDLDLWLAAYTAHQPPEPGWNVVAWQYDDHATVGGDSDLAWQMSALLFPTAPTGPTVTPQEAHAVLNAPIIACRKNPGGAGWWYFASDGGVFPVDGAPGIGSMGGTHLNAPIVDVLVDTNSYALIAADGGVFPFGPINVPTPLPAT